MKKRKEADIVFIRWEDSCGLTGGPWRDWSEVKGFFKRGPIMLTSSGIILHEDKRCVVLTTSLDSQGRSTQPHLIPRSAIKKMWKLDNPSKKGK